MACWPSLWLSYSTLRLLASLLLISRWQQLLILLWSQVSLDNLFIVIFKIDKEYISPTSISYIELRFFFTAFLYLFVFIQPKQLLL